MRTRSRPGASDAYALGRRRMVDAMVARGIGSPRLLEALRAVPRHLFVEEALRAKAYGDHALPIGHAQTISRPLTVALMTELLEVEAHHRVLELGTGSGYQTAVLAHLARHVYTIERLRALTERARRSLRAAGALNVSFKIDDGTLGWPDRAPFDRILATAGGPDLPRSLVAQLGPGGRLVIPIGGETQQRLVLVRRLEDGSVVESDAGECSFVKLVGAEGWGQ